MLTMLRSDPGTSPHEIAAAVSKSSRLQAGEALLSSLKATKADKRAELLALVHRNAGASNDLLHKAIRQLQIEVNDLDGRVADARRAVMPLRAIYGHAMAKAMLPMQREHAAKLLAAIDDLFAAAGPLSESQTLVAQAGGDPLYWPTVVIPPNLVELRSAAQTIIGDEAQ